MVQFDKPKKCTDSQNLLEGWQDFLKSELYGDNIRTLQTSCSLIAETNGDQYSFMFENNENAFCRRTRHNTLLGNKLCAHLLEALR